VTALRPQRDIRPRVLAPAVVIAAAAIVWWLFASGGFFRIDDYIYFANASAKGRWSGDWLSSVFYQHWAPGHRAVFSLMHHATVTAWHSVVLFEIALGMLGLAAFYGSMRLLFGRSSWLLVPLIFFAFTFKLAMPIEWPSSGLQAFPSFAFSALTLYAFLRHMESRRWAWLALAFAALCAGLLFYVRPLTMIVVLLAVRLLFLSPSLQPRALARLLWKERVVWLILGLPVLAYVINYLAHDYFGNQPRPSTALVKEYVKIAWLRNVGPGLFGTILPQDSHLSAQWRLIEIGAQLALGAALAVSLWRKGAEALRAWGFIALVTAMTFALTAGGRLVALGPSVGYDPRYVSDLFWLLPIGLVFALHPRQVLVLGAPWPPRPHRRLAPDLAVAVAAALTLITIENVHQSKVFHDYWRGHASRAYALTVGDSVRAVAKRTGAAVRLPDGPVPDAVIPGNWQEARRSYIVGQYGLPARFDDPRGPDALIDQGGHVVPAHIVTREQLSLADATVSGGTRHGDCVRAPGPRPAIATLQLPRPLRGQLVAIRLTPAGAFPANGLALFLDNTLGYPPQPTALVPAAAGPTTVDTEQTSAAGVRLAVPPGANLCLRSVEFGQVLPGAA
jgi:hypothetical protein